jgi:hypothetical protein
MRLRITLLLVVFGLFLGGCAELCPMRVDFALTPPLDTTYLRYHVVSSALDHAALRADAPSGGEWTREFVVDRGGFAELRRLPDGRAYVLGLRGSRAWMRVGSRPAVEIDGPLASDERRVAAWIGMRFGQPDAGGKTELESCHAGTCTMVTTPPGGRALWVDFDRQMRRPVSFEWIARDHAIESCTGIEYSSVGGATAVASASCSAIVNEIGRATVTWKLEERRSDSVPPEWARVSSDDIVPLVAARDAARFAVADPSMRVHVPVDAGGAPPMDLVLDTGSYLTLLSHRVVEGAGAVPSPDDPPVHVKPPYFPEGIYDPMILDRLVIGGLELHGVPVLVARNDDPLGSGEAGLLGMDLLERFVVDVDGPAATVRLWPRERFSAPGENFTDLHFWGASHETVFVAGAIDEIGPVPVIVDTGAGGVNVIAGGPRLLVRHPHHRDDESALEREDGDGPSDYMTEIDGFHFGPFGLPRMPAVGHERRPDLHFLDGDGALVGLGVLRHFRIAIDARASVVHVAPGPSYWVLSRLGIEVDERGGAPTITRIVEGQHDWKQPLREGDIVRAVDGRRVSTRDEALSAIAAARRVLQITVERNANRITQSIPVPFVCASGVPQQ